MNNDRLKFRVFDTFHNKYIPIIKDETTGAEGFAAFYSQYNNLCKPMSFFLCHQDNIDGHDRYIIEQCTGLRDINGNLIYEGDIVRFVKQRGYYTQKGAIYTIEFGIFRFCGFGWRSRPEHDIEFALTESAAKKCEIIGNIHEQKEQE